MTGPKPDKGAYELMVEDLLNRICPIGATLDYPGPVAPDGWLICDGSTLDRIEYPELFEALGGQASTWGLPTGTTFNLPDLRGVVTVGLDSAISDFDTIAKSGGARTHTLTTAQMPSHTHGQDSHQHNIPARYAQNTTITGSSDRIVSIDGVPSFAGTVPGTLPKANAATAVNQNTGGGGSHNNLQPYRVMNKIIRAA